MTEHEKMAAIADLWAKYVPEWRFMQLMNNFASWYSNDSFYMRDENFLELLEKFLKAVCYEKEMQ